MFEHILNRIAPSLLANWMGSSAAAVGEPCQIDRSPIVASIPQPTVRWNTTVGPGGGDE